MGSDHEFEISHETMYFEDEKKPGSAGNVVLLRRFQRQKEILDHGGDII